MEPVVEMLDPGASKLEERRRKKAGKRMSKTQEADFVRKARERFAYAADADQDQRKAYRDDLTFLNGDQWPVDVKAKRMGAQPPRPCLTINKIVEKVDQISGDFRQSSPAVKVIPVDSKADPKVAEIFGGIVRHVEYNSNASAAYGSAFDGVISGGRGAWRIRVITDRDGEKEIRIERMPNPLVVYWDPESRNVDLGDARYMFVTELLPEAAFRDRYPNAAIQDWDSSSTDEDQAWRTEKKVRVAEYWYWATKKADPEQGLQEKETLFSCLLCGSELLDGPHEWPGVHIPIVVALGKETWIGERRHNRGMVRMAREPQQMYNYWSSSVTEQIALAPTAPFLVTGKMLESSQEMWDAQSEKNYTYLVYTADPMAPIGPKREAPPMMSTAISAELQRMEHDIMSSMGLYQASLGDEGQEKSGKAILARQREGDTGAFGFTNMFEAALTRNGKILIDLIPKVYDKEDVIRIRGEDDSELEVPINQPVGMDPEMIHPSKIQEMQQSKQYQPPTVYNPDVSDYLNDLTVGKYDVRVDIGPSYSTQRQEAAEALLEIVKTVPQAGVAAIDLVVKNLDVPGAAELQKRLEKMIPPGIKEPGPDDPPPEPPPPDPEMLKLELEAQVQKDKLALETRDQDRKEFETLIKGIADLMKAEAAEHGQQLQGMQAQVQALREGIELQNAEKAAAAEAAAPKPTAGPGGTK